MVIRGIRSFLGLGLTVFLLGAQAANLNVGDPAPSFELMDQNGKLQSPSDYRGQWLVLYFYPKDDTPGCTTEACEFRDDIAILKRMNVVVLGISLDDVESHLEFATKYHLPFPLLADRRGDAARAYGALWSLGPVRFAKRHTFIIDPEGNLAEIYRSVTPRTHSDEVIARLEVLRSAQRAPVPIKE